MTIKYRLPELLPGVDRVIWLDADTLILADITELWEVDLDGHWIGTTNGVLTDASMKILNRVTGGAYFWSAENSINAGVMLLDLRLMKTMNVGEILESWTYKHRCALGTPEQQAIA